MSAALDKALGIAVASETITLPKPKLTCERTLTRRGVIWLGQTCNLRCDFCYFIDRVASKEHPEHAFMTLEKAKKICRTLVDFYGNDAVDLQGGEPTIYPWVLELVRYCRKIGLAPTLITNALALENAELCRQYKDAGLADFLVSIQGLGAVHDAMVGVPGAHVKQMRALRNLQEVGIPFRFNCVMSKDTVPQLPGIALLARETGARVVNFITFNPFADQANADMRNTENVPRYLETRDPLLEALALLEEAGVEANVRYFPLCILDEHYRKNIYGFQQLPYDHHEWDYGSWGWTGLQPQRIKMGDTSPPLQASACRGLIKNKGMLKKLAEIDFLKPALYKGHQIVSSILRSGADKEELYRQIARLHAEEHCGYVFGAACAGCSAQPICDGVHGDYAAIFGFEELCPIKGEMLIEDPLFYITRQCKVVMTNDDDQ